MEEASKRSLFRELYQLDDEEIQEEDSSNADAFLIGCRPIALKTTDVAGASHRKSKHSKKSFQGTVSTSLSKSQTPILSRANPLKNSSFSPASSSPIILRKSKEAKMPDASRTATKLAKSDKKRKREQPLEMKPLSRQHFRGLSFCVFMRPCVNMILQLTFSSLRTQRVSDVFDFVLPGFSLRNTYRI